MNNDRLYSITRKIKNNSASKSEKDEYMKFLFDNGNISKSEYDQYCTGRNVEDILKIAVVAGAVVLFGVLISRLSNE